MSGQLGVEAIVAMGAARWPGRLERRREGGKHCAGRLRLYDVRAVTCIVYEASPSTAKNMFLRYLLFRWFQPTSCLLHVVHLTQLVQPPPTVTAFKWLAF